MIERITNFVCGCFFIAVGLGVICLLLDHAFKNDQKRLADLAKAQTAVVAEAPPVVEVQPVIQAQPESVPVKTIDENKVKAVYANLILKDRPKLSLKVAEDWATTIREEEKKYSLPDGLVLAISHTESWHDPKAVSSCGARGLMQVMPPTAKDFAPKVGVWQAPKAQKVSKKASWTAKNNAKKAFVAASKKADKQLVAKLHEPTSNIKVGSKVLAAYLESEKTIPMALKKYSGDATDYHKKVSEYRAVVLAYLESQD